MTNTTTMGAQEIFVIGETPLTPKGYSVRVTSVKFPGAGMRVRLTLLLRGEHIRHLDVSTELAAHLTGLMKEAGKLGAP